MSRNRMELSQEIIDDMAEAITASIAVRSNQGAVTLQPGYGAAPVRESRYAPDPHQKGPYETIKELPERTKKIVIYTALAATALTGLKVFINTGQIEAEADNCTDASSKQIVVETGVRAKARSILERGGQSGEQTLTGTQAMLQKERGYTFSEASFLTANKNSGIITKDKDGKIEQDIPSGIHCVEIPAPAFYGFQWTDGTATVLDLASANLTTLENILKLNPGLADYKHKQSLPEGLMVQVDPRPNQNFVYRTMSKTERDINTLSEGDEATRNQLLRINASILGTGGSVASGEEAWLPYEPTEWMEENDMAVKSIQAAYPVNTLKLQPNITSEDKVDNVEHTEALPAGFAKKLRKVAEKELALWPEGQTDNWDGKENSNPYIKKYTEGQLGPEQSWCAFFVRYALNKSGTDIAVTEKLAGKSFYMPRVKDMYNWMVNANNKSFYVYDRDSIVENKKTNYESGDVIFFNYHGSEGKFQASSGNHVGIVASVGKRLKVIDGNYFKTDAVSLRSMDLNDPQIMAIARPIEAQQSVSGIEIPPQKDLTRIESKRATDMLIERGKDWENRARAMRFFMDYGLEDYQAAGLVGNFVIESGSIQMPSDISQYGGGPGRGFVQWEMNGRFDTERENLVDFAAEQGTSWRDFDTQLKFVIREFETTERSAYAWIQRTTDVRSATEAVLNGYERPALRDVTKRLVEAEQILAAYRSAANSIKG